MKKNATGDYILFTDADTRHAPNSISSGLKCLISKNLDVFSIYKKAGGHKAIYDKCLEVINMAKLLIRKGLNI